MLSRPVQPAVPEGHRCPFCAGLCSEHRAIFSFSRFNILAEDHVLLFPRLLPKNTEQLRKAIFPHSPAGLKHGNCGCWAEGGLSHNLSPAGTKNSVHNACVLAERRRQSTARGTQFHTHPRKGTAQLTTPAEEKEWLEVTVKAKESPETFYPPRLQPANTGPGPHQL
ncbi:Hypothetical predicted protein [Marmota monax]|uniref:Uncharacterized protein n=1 Tax=Marmota monax TaxID=9995 RepID=A0A5E4AIM7_MARMO|nr:Hypothetical predicted protein [Marmota monax]